MTLFRLVNVAHAGSGARADRGDPARGARLRPARPAPCPLLIAADQEGGQFLALGDDATPFAGNMALGAADDEELAERVGRAIGLEARAMGVNVVYAPVRRPRHRTRANPAHRHPLVRRGPGGRRAPRRGVVRGLRSAGRGGDGQAFPGHRRRRRPTRTTSCACVDAPRAVLDARELAPFRAADRGRAPRW